MKSLSIMVLLGHTNYTQAVSLKSYISMLNDSENKLEELAMSKDWDDMLDKTDLFNSKSYTEDSPEAESSVVDEVMHQEEEEAAKKQKEEKQAEEAK